MQPELLEALNDPALTAKAVGIWVLSDEPAEPPFVLGRLVVHVTFLEEMRQSAESRLKTIYRVKDGSTVWVGCEFVDWKVLDEQQSISGVRAGILTVSYRAKKFEPVAAVV